MYCYHCGKYIDEEKLELSSPSLLKAENPKSIDDIKINYVCPRCGHLAHKHHSKEDNKSLARAAHAQVQRSNNSVASGMGKVAIGAILLVTAIIFFFLSQKAANGFEISTTCAEFYVFLVLGIISVILLVWGTISSLMGVTNKKRYLSLLKDLNNNTFVQ